MTLLYSRCDFQAAKIINIKLEWLSVELMTSIKPDPVSYKKKHISIC